jgi:hypothetical protein
MHLAAIFLELLPNDFRCALLLEAELGMGMDVAADLGQLVEIVQHLGDDRHVGSDRSAIAPHHSGFSERRHGLKLQRPSASFETALRAPQDDVDFIMALRKPSS